MASMYSMNKESLIKYMTEDIKSRKTRHPSEFNEGFIKGYESAMFYVEALLQKETEVNHE